jgi:hypothetical protein
MKKKDITPLESLQRAKLMMGYDTSKTLTENRVVINEQEASITDISKAAREIDYLLTGNVKYKHLTKIKNTLEDDILGKKTNDGKCALNKLFNYYEKIEKNPFSSSYTWRKTLLADLTYEDFWNRSTMIKDIKNSKEASEPEFEDAKEELLKLIDKELKTFCKTNSSTSTDQKSNVDYWKQKFPCVFNTQGATDGTIKQDTSKYYYLVINGNKDKYRLYNNGAVWHIQKAIRLGVLKCDNNNIIIENKKPKKLLEQINDDKLQQKLQQTQQQQTQQTQQQQSQQQTTGKLHPIPKALVNSSGVGKFQEWVNNVAPGILGRFGVDRKYGDFTKNAWEKYGERYLKELSGGSTSSTSTTSTQPTKPTLSYGAETTSRPATNTTANYPLQVSDSGGVETEYMADGTY